MENTIQTNDAENSQELEINVDELDVVAGGGLFGDIYDAINDAWTDIKKGVVDGFQGN